MKDYVKRCGRLARMFSIGSSVEGRPLWALEISKTPGKVEAKPNARLVGNMHGDEPASRSVVLLGMRHAHCNPASVAQLKLSAHISLQAALNPWCSTSAATLPRSRCHTDCCEIAAWTLTQQAVAMICWTLCKLL